ncbi:cytoplasmic polyadenylation element-binding protein 4-like isoform X1 [Lates japonicus]|uniref:Cytoplasmic polyadenylation element-binding protein 4-like isoform X1 n=1 Tax=Lates japonicus TaxID=270547 RepID=A0AAD3NKR9_LATJO|nr:cytoplasmic polyadenylation element-binding protein 4-like isoform X1 [Lates japonicus]
MGGASEGTPDTQWLVADGWGGACRRKCHDAELKDKEDGESQKSTEDLLGVLNGGLRHPHHPSNPPSPPSFVNNTCSTNGGSAWLFPAVAQHSNMQDEILESDKSKALDLQDMQEKSQVQTQPQALSPGQQEAGGGLGELEGALPEDGSLEKGSLESSGGKEKLRMESPVLSGFDYQDSLGMVSSGRGRRRRPLTAALLACPRCPNFPPRRPRLWGGGQFLPQIGPVSQHHAPTPHPQHYHPHGHGVPQQHPALSSHPPQPSFLRIPIALDRFTQRPQFPHSCSEQTPHLGSYQPLHPTSTS